MATRTSPRKKSFLGPILASGSALETAGIVRVVPAESPTQARSTPRRRPSAYSKFTSPKIHATVSSVLTTPRSPYDINQIHFVLWYSLTTILNPTPSPHSSMPSSNPTLPSTDGPSPTILTRLKPATMLTASRSARTSVSKGRQHMAAVYVIST